MTNIISGNELMMFIKKGNEYYSVGYATSQTCSISLSYDRISSKSHTIFGSIDPSAMGWSMTTDDLMTENNAESFFEMMTNKTIVTLMFGIPSNYDKNGLEHANETAWQSSEGYVGKAIITNFVLNSKNGDVSSYSVEFLGVSELTKIGSTPSSDPTLPSRVQANLFFVDDNVEKDYTSTNTYKLPDLSNPLNLPIRYVVGPTYYGRVLEEDNSQYLKTPDVGLYEITAIFDGNDELQPTSATLHVKINADGTIESWTTQPIEQGEQSNIKINPILRFVKETSVVEPNQYRIYDIEELYNPYNLTNIVYSSTNPNVTIDNINKTVTVPSGVGSYVIKATFAGDANYNPIECTYTLLVSNVTQDKLNVTWHISTATVNVSTSSSETYTGTIREISIDPSSLASSVKIYMNDILLNTNSINLTTAGTYIIRYVFEGNEEYNASSIQYQIVYTQTQEPERVSPNLSFANSTVNITKTENDYVYTLQQVTNPNNVSPILYYVNGQQVSSSTYTITTSGSFTVSAVYEGNETYLPQTVTYSVVVSQEKQNVTWNISTATVNVSTSSSETYTGMVKEVLINPSELSQYVKIYMNDVLLDSLNINLTTAGTYIIRYVFEGNDNYNPSSTQYQIVYTQTQDEIDYSEQYLTFEAIDTTTFSLVSPEFEDTYNNTVENGTLISNNTDIYYSFNNGDTWNIVPYASNFSVTVQAGTKMSLKATLNWSPGLSRLQPLTVGKFTSTGRFKVYGNVSSLIERPPRTQGDVPWTPHFSRMFYMNDKLVDASNLVLPKLGNIRGVEMFAHCTSLISAPKIIELVEGNTPQSSCLGAMFYHCTSLINPPALPSTNLHIYCYEDMFRACYSLVNAPELPATTLVEGCYESMFNYCSSLNYIKCLATDMSAYMSTDSWVYHVSQTGTFVKAANTTWPTGVSGIPSGWTVIEE